ncbi:unnamed protein product [Somion occarium]|uniref:Uncharacterized protein n=1 Tax=Somion occarium TaxID=3059160 RepID=A0ABP1EAK5_9APHY
MRTRGTGMLISQNLGLHDMRGYLRRLLRESIHSLVTSNIRVDWSSRSSAIWIMRSRQLQAWRRSIDVLIPLECADLEEGCHGQSYDLTYDSLKALLATSKKTVYLEDVKKVNAHSFPISSLSSGMECLEVPHYDIRRLISRPCVPLHLEADLFAKHATTLAGDIKNVNEPSKYPHQLFVLTLPRINPSQSSRPFLFLT